MRARQHRGHGRYRGAESAAHGGRPQHELADRREEQDERARETERAKPPPHGVELEDPRGQDEQVDREAADQAGQGHEADPAHEPGKRLRHHFTRNGKLPSVRWPSRATTLQNTW